MKIHEWSLVYIIRKHRKTFIVSHVQSQGVVSAPIASLLSAGHRTTRSQWEKGLALSNPCSLSLWSPRSTKKMAWHFQTRWLFSFATSQKLVHHCYRFIVWQAHLSPTSFLVRRLLKSVFLDAAMWCPWKSCLASVAFYDFGFDNNLIYPYIYIYIPWHDNIKLTRHNSIIFNNS